MTPQLLFPWLAALFAALTLWTVFRQRRLTPQGRTFTLLALAFAAVAWWLHSGA